MYPPNPMIATRGAIDISKEDSANLLDDLLDEYADLFPGAQWHLGGDEYQAHAERGVCIAGSCDVSSVPPLLEPLAGLESAPGAEPR